MEIRIKTMKLENFKGKQSLTLSFDGRSAIISGGNAKGKSTVFDAFTWCLWGKDSLGRTDFEIMPIDPNTHDTIHHLNTSVTLVLNVDGRDIELKRLYQEEWTTPNGESEPRLTNHPTSFFIDTVPMKKTQYTAYIDQLCNENTFRMLTDPKYFNTKYKDSERRTILMAMVNDKVDFSGVKVKFADLLAEMGGQTLEEFKKKISNQIKEHDKRINYLVPFIDGKRSSVPTVVIDSRITELLDKDKKELQALKAPTVEAAKEADQTLTKEWNDLNGKVWGFVNAATKAENERESKNKAAQLNAESRQRANDSQIKAAQDDNRSIDSRINATNKDIELKKKEIEGIRQEYESLKTLTFNFTIGDTCPTCGQPLPDSYKDGKREEAKKKFLDSRTQQAQSIKERYDNAKKQLAEFEEQVKQLQSDKDKNDRTISDFTTKNTEIAKELAELKKFEKKSQETIEQEVYERKDVKPLIERMDAIEAMKTADESQQAASDGTEGKDDTKAARIEELEKEIKKCEDDLKLKETRDTMLKEIEDYEKELAQNRIDKANLQKTEFKCDAYYKANMEAVEETINGMFGHVRFKFIESQMNGGENQICECWFNGCPYIALNNGGIIQAGLDIIAAFQKHYNISAPIFIDNSESIEYGGYAPDCQMIYLEVMKGKELNFNLI